MHIMPEVYDVLWVGGVRQTQEIRASIKTATFLEDTAQKN